MAIRHLFQVSVVVAVLGISAILLWTGPMIEAGGLEPFDTRTRGYSHADAVAFLSALTETGRAAYLGPQRIADTVFPIGFASALALGIFLGVRVWTRAGAAVLALVPLVYLAFDMLENAAVAAMLRAGATGVTPAQVAQASALGQWKFTFVNLSLVLAGVSLAARLLFRFRRRGGS